MDFSTYIQFFIALAIVLALIAVFAWLARRFGLGGGYVPRRGQARRLSVVEATAVDAKRRLVLVRRDDTEHLVLLGGASDILVERDIPAPEADTPPVAEVRRVDA